MASKTIYQRRFTPTVATLSGRPMNPLVAIWTQPREAIRFLLETEPGLFVHTLAALGAISALMGQLTLSGGAPKAPLALVLTAVIFVACVAGIVQLYFFAALVNWTGRLLGGRGTFQEMRTALAWSQVPLIAGLFLIWGPALVIYGAGLFAGARPAMGASPELLFSANGFLLAHYAMTLWSLIILILGVAEAHKVANIRGLATVAATIAVLAVIGGLLAATGLGAVAAAGLAGNKEKPQDEAPPLPPTFVDVPY